MARKLSDVVADGDYRTSLEALRDELVTAMEGCPPGAKAQTAAQLRAVLKDIDGLPGEKKLTVADDLVARRKARRAAAQAAASAAASGD